MSKCDICQNSNVKNDFKCHNEILGPISNVDMEFECQNELFEC